MKKEYFRETQNGSKMMHKVYKNWKKNWVLVAQKIVIKTLSRV